MTLGLLLFGIGFALLLLGAAFHTLGMRGAGMLEGLGGLLGVIGAVLVVVAGAHGGWGPFVLTLLATIVGLAGVVVVFLAAGYAFERVLPRLLFPLRRRAFAAAIADPSSVRRTAATREGGIHDVRLWGDRGLVVTSLADSQNKDGCCAVGGYLHTEGEAPVIGETIPRSGRIDDLTRLADAWWRVHVKPHPDWPEARKPGSPDWSA